MCVQRFDDSQLCCYVHYISRFAAFFIDTRAKRSSVESFMFFGLIQTQTTNCSINSTPRRRSTVRFHGFAR